MIWLDVSFVPTYVFKSIRYLLIFFIYFINLFVLFEMHRFTMFTNALYVIFLVKTSVAEELA